MAMAQEIFMRRRARDDRDELGQQAVFFAQGVGIGGRRLECVEADDRSIQS